MIVTISGTAGSGKSTIAKKIVNKYNYEYISIGQYRRNRAKELGMTINEYNKKGETDYATDREADEYLKNLGLTKDNIVIDARLGFYFVPNSYKIFLKVALDEGAVRIFAHRREDEGYDSMEKAIASLKERQESDTMRYQKYYKVDWQNPDNFDLVVDTTGKDVEKVTSEVIDALDKVMNNIKSQP